MASTGVRHRGQAAARLGLLLGVEVAAVVVLHRLGTDPRARVPLHGLGRWLASTPPGDATWAVVRLLGLACAWWQLGSTLAYLAARAARLPRLVAGLGWACLPGVRRLVDATLAVSVLTGALASAGAARANPTTTAGPVVVQVGPPPAASAPGHAYVPVAVGDGVADSTSMSTTSSTSTTAAAAASTTTTKRAPTSTSTTSPASSAPGMPLPPPASPGRAPAIDPAANTYEVVAGDNLWVIAARHLAQVTGRPVGALAEAEIAEHWLAVLDANHGRWRSGNPNLIYPGEVVILPPLGPVSG